MEIRQTEIKIKGLKKEYKFLQISDLHILKTDERDLPERIKGYKGRADEYFTYNGIPSYDYLPMFLDYAKGVGAFPVYTGDTVDIPTESAFDVLDDSDIRPENSLFLLGNHDWSFMDHYYKINVNDSGKDDFRCKEYFDKYYPRYKKYAQNGNLNCQAVYLPELIYAGFDTGNDKFDKEQYEFLLQLTKKGLPIIVFCHTPFYCKTLHQPMVDLWGEATAESQVINSKRNPMDEYTEKFYKLMLKPESNVVAVVAGHIHQEHDDLIEDKLPQYVADGAYKGIARLYTVKGE